MTMKKKGLCSPYWIFPLQAAMLVAAANAPGLSNPSATYCQDLGYQYDIRQSPEGDYGVCVFGDGNACRAWDFLNGECGSEYSYCETNGGALETHVGSECPEELGLSRCAMCTLESGEVCPEWEYFSGECPAGSGRGCSCAVTGAGQPGLHLLVMLALLSLLVVRRRLRG